MDVEIDIGFTLRNDAINAQIANDMVSLVGPGVTPPQAVRVVDLPLAVASGPPAPWCSTSSSSRTARRASSGFFARSAPRPTTSPSRLRAVAIQPGAEGRPADQSAHERRR